MNEFKPVEELELSDDFIFCKVMKNPEICKELLERLLKIQIEKIEYPVLQKEISPYYKSKGVRLDVYVKDSNRVFDIEMQNGRREDIAKRTRYYQSMIDIDNLMKGEGYRELKESFIIFITTFDPFGMNLPVYTFKNQCQEDSSLLLQDKAVKCFYNATAYEKEPNVEIRKFLEYIINHKPTDDFTKELDKQVNDIKADNDNKVEYMIEAISLYDARNDGFALGKQQGISIGILQKAIETARNLLASGLSLEQIANAVNLPLAEVQKLAQEQNKK
ncbi:MAG: Rpn family recombination-promoting nuclease/putative transposase [Treponema sp.]|nr:Rpn family recombination-promoting nuclease/putative transposase [Spirochaetia bacterium]MDY5812887.1 Rpn family recombination-promoting nuclease/putative transposase [Treponema sp.]MEE1182555.1 Rpn family recombination-promoting nuclease/putative transposase [Treponema sp.]